METSALSYVLALLLAHVLGDFVLQPRQWVAKKQASGFKSPVLYAHIGIHAVLSVLLTGFYGRWLVVFAVVAVTHGLIDLVKIYGDKSGRHPGWFVADQLAHVGVIVGLFALEFPLVVGLAANFLPIATAFALCLLLCTVGSSVFIRIIMSSWALNDSEDAHSLKNAGQTIGILERLFVFSFVILGQWSAIGFLMGAKSVFRFGDLSRAKDRKLTEYILIGTLLSFALAVASALAFKWCLKQLEI